MNDNTPLSFPMEYINDRTIESVMSVLSVYNNRFKYYYDHNVRSIVVKFDSSEDKLMFLLKHPMDKI